MAGGNFFIQTDLCMGRRGLFISTVNDRVGEALAVIDGAMKKTGFVQCDGRGEPAACNPWELMRGGNLIEVQQTIGCDLDGLYDVVSNLRHAFAKVGNTFPFYVGDDERGKMLEKAGDEGNYLHITPNSDLMGGATMYYGNLNSFPEPRGARVIKLSTYYH